MAGERPMMGMGMGVENRLKGSGEHSAKGVSAAIGKAELCPSCGYDLRATPMGAPCPECGMYRPTGKVLVDAPMSTMPIKVIRRFVRGARVLAVCLVASVALGAGASKWMPGLDVPWVMMGVSVLWVAGCLGITPVIENDQGRFHGFGARGKLRAGARWLQLAWAPAWGLIGVASSGAVSGVAERAVVGGAMLLVIAGLTGGVMLCLLMRELAQWVRDDLAERLMLGAAWTYGLVLPIALVGYLKFQVFVFVMVAFGLSVLLGMLMLPAGLLSLCHTIELSQQHYREHLETDARRQKRIEAQFKEMTDRLVE